MVRLPGMDRCCSFAWLCNLIHFCGSIASSAQPVPGPIYCLLQPVYIYLCTMVRVFHRRADPKELGLGRCWSHFTGGFHHQKHTFTASLAKIGWILVGFRSPLVGRDLWFDGCASALRLTCSGCLAGIYPLELDRALAGKDLRWRARRIRESVCDDCLSPGLS